MKTLIFFLLLSLSVRSQDITLKTPLTPAKAVTVTTATGLGYVPGTTLSVLQSAHTLTDNAIEQAALGSAQDVWTLQGSTLYEIDGFYDVSSGGTTHTTATGFVLGGGASINWIKYDAILWGTAINTNINSFRYVPVDQVASTVINTTVTSTRVFIRVRGFVSINAGGTIQPTIKYSVQTNGTCEMGIGSYIKFIPVGANNITTIGPIN